MDRADEVADLVNRVLFEGPIWLNLFFLGCFILFCYGLVNTLRKRDWWGLVTTFGIVFTTWAFLEWWDGYWPIWIPILSGLVTLIWSLGRKDDRTKGSDDTG